MLSLHMIVYLGLVAEASVQADPACGPHCQVCILHLHALGLNGFETLMLLRGERMHRVEPTAGLMTFTNSLSIRAGCLLEWFLLFLVVVSRLWLHSCCSCYCFQCFE
jgi:hypothetical protein